MDPGKDPLTLVGAGRRGLALGRLLALADWPLEGIADASHDRALEATLLLGCPAFPDPREPAARSRFVLLAVPDEAVPALLRHLAPFLGPETVVAHTGPAGSRLLRGVRLPLAWRPQGPVPAPDSGVASLEGAPVLLEGHPEAVPRGAALVRALGGTPRVLDSPEEFLALARPVVAEEQAPGKEDAKPSGHLDPAGNWR